MKYLTNVTTLKYSIDKCVGCGRCVEVCPRGVFAIIDNIAAVTDKDSCLECGACARNCDYNALSVNAGVGCASAIINSMLTGGEPTCACSEPSGESGCC